MKKLVALAMSLTMAFSLVACGNSDASNTSTSTDAAATTAASTEAAQTAPAEKQDVSLRIWGA